MANQRVFLFIALFCISFLMWEAWQQDYGPQNTVTTMPGTDQQVPSSSFTGLPDVNESKSSADDLDIPRPSSTQMPVEQDISSTPVAGVDKFVSVETDLLRLKINLSGGTVSRAELLKYPVSLDEDSDPLVLLNDFGSEFYVAQSGVISNTHGNLTHRSEFTAKQQSYVLNGDSVLDVELMHVNDAGIVISKNFRFRKDSYVIELTHQVVNNSSEVWQGRQYTHLVRTSAGSEMRMVPTYTGGVFYNTKDKYEKVSFDDMAESPASFETTGGWAAIIQHYFVGAWIPEITQSHAYYAKRQKDGMFRIGMASPDFQVNAGDTGASSAKLYLGPKLQDRLEVVSEGLELTVDYGMLTVISKPLFIVLNWIHGVIGNWGWAIILLTVLLKLIFYKLSETSYRSMAGMRKLQPKLKSLRERYGDDKERMKTAMMDLYREEKINPLGGCLPILVQIPVFLALYWVLLESVELRQAPFMLWIQDLSVQDPFYILPVLMGASMFIQQKLNPTPVDPMQAKVMMILPIVFTFFFLFFPAGLVLYWVVNNTLSITQQWVIMKRVDQGK